jgi:Rrf2 family protein
MMFSDSRIMLRLSKRVEYGLIALQHLAKRGTAATVREIADENEISYDLLAKIMQDLKRDGMIFSHQGVRGGYTLILAPDQISLTRVVSALEKETSITECTSGTEQCAREAVCTIKGPMHKLQSSMEQVFNSMTIAQLL